MPADQYMLDTNTVSYLIKGKPAIVGKHLKSVPMASICISAITEAELLHGVAKKPEAKKLQAIVTEFLLCTKVLPWNSDAAHSYATLRTLCEREGNTLATLDMLIAAHSLAENRILVTNDKAFYQLEHHLVLQNWAAPQ